MCFLVSYFSGVCVCFVSAVYFCVLLLFVWHFFVNLVCIFTVSGLAGYSGLYVLNISVFRNKGFHQRVYIIYTYTIIYVSLNIHVQNECQGMRFEYRRILSSIFRNTRTH